MTGVLWILMKKGDSRYVFIFVDESVIRLGKASRASSALYNSVRAEPYRAEIPKLGPKPSRGPARLCPSQSLTSLRTARLVKLVQLGKM